MSIVRQGSLERIRTFGYAQLSSFLVRYQVNDTIKALSQDSGVRYNTLIGIKNMTLRSISLNRLIDIMDKVGMDYDISFKNVGGRKEVKMEIDRSVFSEAVERVLKRETFADLFKHPAERNSTNGRTDRLN